MRIGIMASGQLGYNCLKQLAEIHGIACVLTDKHSSGIMSLTAVYNIPCFIGNPRKGKAEGFIKELPIDILLSINYLFLVEEDILSWPSKAAINFHGSLLPKYRGRTPHVWAIINGETTTGITAHQMTLGCDQGDVVASRVIPISDLDTGGTLLEKYMEIYPELIQEVVESFIGGTTKFLKQEEWKATYFEKRTPDDGAIDWNWQKERIRNWVRAQAHPYPGAFATIKGNKVVIDQIEFDDYGFKQSQPNGLILTENPYRVKTPNGVIILKQIREGSDVLSVNSVFDRL
jgi:methionyl-tRNA formyltransferase